MQSVCNLYQSVGQQFGYCYFTAADLRCGRINHPYIIACGRPVTECRLGDAETGGTLCLRCVQNRFAGHASKQFTTFIGQYGCKQIGQIVAGSAFGHFYDLGPVGLSGDGVEAYPYAVRAIKCDDNIKRYLWITLSASWTILLFGGKFIIDIINIFTDEYKFGINFVMVYVILNLIFLFFNFARLKVIKSNFVYEIVCDVSFVIGINIFVFTQRDTARFQVLILSAYLCCLYLLNIRDLLRKI